MTGRRLRILMLHDRFLPDSRGGGEYVAFERARGLIAAGHEVEVICTGDPSVTSHGGVTTRRLGLPRQGLALAMPALVAAARRSDIVHGLAYQAAPVARAAARLARRPVVCEQIALFGEAWHALHPGWKGRAMAQAERLQLGLRYDGHIFLNEASLDLGRAMGAAGPRQVVIAPGIAWESDADLPPADLDPVPEVLFAGRFDDRKGLDRLLGIARVMPHTRFAGVGWWPSAARPADVPPNLALLERKGPAYRAALRSTPIFFFPSRAETFGLVIYEAMAEGCSVISTIPGPYRGAYLGEYSADAAITALNARLSDPARVAAEGAENRRRAAELTWHDSTRRVLDLYHDILGRRGDGAWHA